MLTQRHDLWQCCLYSLITVDESVRSPVVTIDCTICLILTSMKCAKLYVTTREGCVMFKNTSQKTTPFLLQFRERRQDSTTATRFCVRRRSPIYRNFNKHKIVSLGSSPIHANETTWHQSWLPIAAWIDYKIAILIFKSLVSRQPSYLCELFAYQVVKIVESIKPPHCQSLSYIF